MKIALFFAVLLCGGVVRVECSPARQRYSFRYDGHTAQLWDARHKRALWKRGLIFADKLTWSSDHRALAIEGSGTRRRHSCVLVWREGFRVREFDAQGDYSMGCLWSPDNRRLLVRYGISGDADMDVGSLYCLEFKPWPSYSCYELGAAYRMKWNNALTVTYWDRDFSATHPARLVDRRVWHVPLHRKKHSRARKH